MARGHRGDDRNLAKFAEIHEEHLHGTTPLAGLDLLHRLHRRLRYLPGGDGDGRQRPLLWIGAGVVALGGFLGRLLHQTGFGKEIGAVTGVRTRDAQAAGTENTGSGGGPGGAARSRTPVGTLGGPAQPGMAARTASGGRSRSRWVRLMATLQFCIVGEAKPGIPGKTEGTPALGTAGLRRLSMSPEGVNTLSISADVRGSAVVVRVVGELDYDYAPIFRRELTRAWSMGTGNSPSGLPVSPQADSSSELPAPPPLDVPSGLSASLPADPSSGLPAPPPLHVPSGLSASRPADPSSESPAPPPLDTLPGLPGSPAPPSSPVPLLSETSVLLESPLLPETSRKKGTAKTPRAAPSSRKPRRPRETRFPRGRPHHCRPSLLRRFFPGSSPPPTPGSPPPLFPDGPSPLSPDLPPPEEPPSDGRPSDGLPSLSTTTSSPLSPQVPTSFGTSPDTRAASTPGLVLDLEGLTFCDSTGLAELLWILRRSQETRTRLVVAGASRALRHMMAITGLLTIFTMATSVEEALLEEPGGRTLTRGRTTVPVSGVGRLSAGWRSR